MITPRTLKGFRDFLPNEAKKREYVIKTLKSVFENFGFEPLETPTLEYEEILAGKYGEEGEKLMYRFEDLGKRRVAMRYDQTVPLARMIAQYLPSGDKISLPFKRYQISNVWRAENTQKGRFREFLQCDIDTAGSPNLLADAEIISCVITSAKKLGFKKIKILINDRIIFKDLKPEFIAAIDKIEKIGNEAVIEELINKGMDKDKARGLIESFITMSPTPTLKSLFKILTDFGLKEGKNFVFSPELARGLDYYTGAIFELKDESYPTGSLGGGGRYDKLLNIFTQQQEIPCVGFAFGFDRIIEAMDALNLFPTELANSTSKVLITIFSEEQKQLSINTLNTLRKNNINSEIFLGEIKNKNPLEKQLKFAIQKNIPYLIIIGPEEAEKNTYILKNLTTREQRNLTLEEIISIVT